MEDVDVVIIGGGGCGLTLSSLLSNYGIKHVLFEQRPGTSRLPKAHMLNQRTMEIFRQHDLAEEVVKQGADGQFYRRVIWKTSLGGDAANDRKVLASVNAFPGGGLENQDAPHGPMCSRNLPQCRLEPILKEQAEKRNGSGVLFNQKVTGIESSSSGTVVTVQNAEGKERLIKAKFIVGADGGKFVGGKIGCEMKGIKEMYRVVTTHFKADLSDVWEEDLFLADIQGERGEASVLPMGPTWGKHSEEWVFHIAHAPNSNPDTSAEQVKSTIASVLKVPESRIEILLTSTWGPECVLADSYRKENVFLAGDSAHRHPPTSGLGLNTAVADAHNLAWKLALVTKHGINDKILNSYEQERHPVGRRNCDWALMALSNRRVVAASLAMAGTLGSLYTEKGSLGSMMTLLQETLNLQKIEFSAHDLEIGHVYEHGVVVPDGIPRVPADPMGQKYCPSTRPGHRLPHSWLRRGEPSDGNKISTHDLVGKSLQFVLITDPKGEEWTLITERNAATFKGLLRVVVILPRGSKHVGGPDEYIDDDGSWSTLSEVRSGGAILVRPDNYVAWRASEPAGGSVSGLLSAWERLLSPQQAML